MQCFNTWYVEINVETFEGVEKHKKGGDYGLASVPVVVE
jgi:hypothetical protein